MRNPKNIATGLAVALGGVWAWWAWKSGAYFGSVFYPGTAVLVVLLLAVVLVVRPLRLQPRREAVMALGFLLALAAWTLLSRLWTSVPDQAVPDATQTFAYGAAFALGLWLRRLARSPLTGLLPVAMAGAVAGLAVAAALAAGHDLTAYLHPDASLRFPLGYRNANGAFFLIALWPALTLAASPSTARWLRAAMLGAATLCIDLAILSQSRGSMIAAAVAVVVVFALSPRRLRLATYLGLAALPALVALPVLLDLYRHGSPIGHALPLLRHAAVAVALSTAAALAIGAFAPVAERRIGLAPDAARRIERWLAIFAVGLAAVGLVAFVAKKGGPARFVDQRVREFTQGGYPDLHSQGVRFGANVGSNRNDFWRVALGEGIRRPLGGGAGSFQLDYLRERRSHETPTDPHSVEMLMFSELGLPGLFLFFGFVVVATSGATRSRLATPADSPTGVEGRALAAAALASGAYWLVHASFDWFWNYPAMTAPVLCLLGAAIAQQASGSARRSSSAGERVAMNG